MASNDRDAQQRLEAILDAMHEVVVIVGVDGRNRFANTAMERVLGFTPVEVFGSSATERMHPDDRSRVERSFRSIGDQPGASVTVRYRALHRDGRWIPVEAKGTNLLHDPAVNGLVVTVRDLSAELAAAERFRQIADHATDVIYRLWLDPPAFEYVNDAIVRVTGLTPTEIAADPVRRISQMLHPDDLPLVESYLRPVGDAPRLDTVELRWVDRHGHVTWAEHRFNVRRDPRSGRLVVDGIARDINALKAIEAELSFLAQQDELTGLPNRRALLEIMTERLRQDGELGVLFLDLDGFKEVNDTQGHDAGDQLLMAVAGRLSANIRADDVVVRFAGDEFVVLTDVEGLVWLAHRLLNELGAPFSLSGGPARVTASIGTAIGRAGEDPTALLRRADQAMYAAKRAGKGRISHAHAA